MCDARVCGPAYAGYSHMHACPAHGSLAVSRWLRRGCCVSRDARWLVAAGWDGRWCCCGSRAIHGVSTRARHGCEQRARSAKCWHPSCGAQSRALVLVRPYPVVNVIVANPASGKTAEQGSLRQARRAAMERRAEAQKRRHAQSQRASETLSQEIELGSRVRSLAAVVRGLASQRQQIGN